MNVYLYSCNCDFTKLLMENATNWQSTKGNSDGTITIQAM